MSPLWNLDISSFQSAVDWLVEGLRKNTGLAAVRTVFDPNLGLWYFYGEDSNLLARLEHDTVERAKRIVEHIQQQRIDAEVDRLVRESKRGK